MEIKFIHTNYDGFASKKGSFEENIDDGNPVILIIKNTSLKGTRKSKNYFLFFYTRNRENNKGGVAAEIIC